jgi:predicted dehydrogenase
MCRRQPGKSGRASEPRFVEAIHLTGSRAGSVEADAILTVTPPPVHLSHAQIGIRAWAALITEKPFADTLETPRRCCAYRKLRGKSYPSRRTTATAGHFDVQEALRAKPAVTTGMGIGFLHPRRFHGSFRETMEFPLLVDMAIHHIDMIRRAGPECGARHGVLVQAFVELVPARAGLKMFLEMEDGTPFSYAGDWSAKGRATSWNGNWRLQCAEGALHMETTKYLYRSPTPG